MALVREYPKYIVAIDYGAKLTFNKETGIYIYTYEGATSKLLLVNGKWSGIVKGKLLETEEIADDVLKYLCGKIIKKMVSMYKKKMWDIQFEKNTTYRTEVIPFPQPVK